MPLDVVHLDKVPLDVVQSKPALSMLVALEEVVHLDKVPLDVVPLEEVPQDVVPLEEKVPLDLVHLEEEQCKRKLHQMEADSPAVNVIAYMCIIAKLGNGEGLWIGMEPLRGVFRTIGSPIISSSI